MIAPGQVVSRETVTFLEALSPAEILGLDPDLGVRIFKESYFRASGASARPKPRKKAKALGKGSASKEGGGQERPKSRLSPRRSTPTSRKQ